MNAEATLETTIDLDVAVDRSDLLTRTRTEADATTAMTAPEVALEAVVEVAEVARAMEDILQRMPRFRWHGSAHADRSMMTTTSPSPPAV